MLTPSKLRVWHCYLVIVFLLLVASFFVPIQPVFPPQLKVQDPAKAALDLVDGVVKLVTGVNTAMLAGAAALTIKGTSWTSSWSKADSVIIIFVFLGGAISYFGVYLCYVRALTMINQSAFYPIESGIIWSLRLQYFGIILGVVSLGLVFSRVIEGRTPSPPPSIPL